MDKNLLFNVCGLLFKTCGLKLYLTMIFAPQHLVNCLLDYIPSQNVCVYFSCSRLLIEECLNNKRYPQGSRELLVWGWINI